MNLEILKEQLNSAIVQRDQFAQAFQQSIGAINLLQEQIKLLLSQAAIEQKRLEDEAAKALEEAKALEDARVLEEAVNTPQEEVTQ